MITYGTLIGQNTATITDPYHDGILRGWMPEGLIVKKLFAQVPSKTYKGRIPKQNTPGQIRSDITIGQDGFPEIKLDFEATDTYKLVPRGLTAALTGADVEELGGPAQAQAKTLAILDANVQISREYGIAKSATDISIQTQYFSVTKTWDDPTADIMADLVSLFQICRTGISGSPGCGMTPNTAIIPWPVFNVISRHPQLIKAYFFGVGSQGGAMSLDEAQMAKLFNLKRIFVPQAMYYSNAVGATSARADIWGKNLIVARIDESPNPTNATQSWGYTFNPASPVLGNAEFSYTWQTPGVLAEHQNKVTKGYMADDRIVDVNSAVLVPNVIS